MVFIYGELQLMKDWLVNQWHESEHTICGERKKVCQSHILFFGKLFKLCQHRLWQIVYRASCTQRKIGRNKKGDWLVMMLATLMLRSPTIELHGDLAELLVVHNDIGVVIGLPDRDVSVQLCTSSWSVQEKASCTKQCGSKGRERTDVYPLALACPGLAGYCRAVIFPNTGDYCRKRCFQLFLTVRNR